MKNSYLIIFMMVIGIFLITLGSSMAIFSYRASSNKIISYKTGDITFKYTELSGIGNGINMENALPITDNEGVKLDTYFDFKIDANLIQSDMIYEISLDPTKTTDIPFEGIKIYITEIVDGKEKKINSNLDKEGKIKKISDYDNLIIYQERILKNTKNYSKHFRIRMWIADDINIYADEYFNKQGGFKINVNARSDYNMVNKTIEAPIITGGEGEVWTTSVKTIDLVPPELALGGIKNYEYYITDNKNEVVNDLTIPTGICDGSLKITRVGKNYVYYRILALDDSISDWSKPQVVYYDNKEYTITYNLNGGTLKENPPSTYNVETEEFNLPTPTYPEYIFEGWYENPDLKGNKITKITKGSRGNKQLYAKWKSEYIDINFDVYDENENAATHLGYSLNCTKGDYGDICRLIKDGIEVTNLEIPATYTYNNQKYRITTLGSSNPMIIAGLFKTVHGASSITIPDTITNIQNDTFMNFTDLENVNIPSSVTEIGRNAFNNTRLSTITIPASVKKIGTAAFNNNTRLSTVYINSIDVEFEKNCFSDLHKNYCNKNGGALCTTTYGSIIYVKSEEIRNKLMSNYSKTKDSIMNLTTEKTDYITIYNEDIFTCNFYTEVSTNYDWK